MHTHPAPVRSARLHLLAVAILALMAGCGPNRSDAPAAASASAPAASAPASAASAASAQDALAKKLAGRKLIDAKLLADAKAAMPTQPFAFQIDGRIEGLADGKRIELIEERKGKTVTLAQTKVKGGQFTLKGKASDVMRATLKWNDEYGFSDVLLEPTPIQVVITDTEFQVNGGGPITALMTGYEQMPEYQEGLAARRAAPDPFEGVDLERDEAALEAARAKSDELEALTRTPRDAYMQQLFDADAPGLLKLLTLDQYMDPKYQDKAARTAMFASLRKEIGDHPKLASWEQSFEDMEKARAVRAATDVGAQYVDVTALTQDGKTILLSEVVKKNRYTLLDLWAHWCGPCRAEFPHLKKVYAELHGQGFEIFGVSVDPDRKLWLKAMKEDDLPWVNAIESDALAGTAQAAYGADGIPFNVLIDQEGKIVAKNLREFEGERVIRALVTGKKP